MAARGEQGYRNRRENSRHHRLWPCRAVHLQKSYQGFDARILAYDKYNTGGNTIGHIMEMCSDLNPIFSAEADIVSFHVPLQGYQCIISTKILVRADA